MGGRPDEPCHNTEPRSSTLGKPSCHTHNTLGFLQGPGFGKEGVKKKTSSSLEGED